MLVVMLCVVCCLLTVFCLGVFVCWFAACCQTIVADFQLSQTAGGSGEVVLGVSNASALSGRVYKRLAADGTWLVSGVASIVTHEKQVCVLLVYC